MITLCWAAKGGSGTTVVVAACALADDRPTLVVDLVGDVPMVLGLPDPDGPGIRQWLRSDAPSDRLDRLEIPVDATTTLLPAGPSAGATDAPTADRWAMLARHLARDGRVVVVDAGTGVPPGALAAEAERRWLVTRSCYLALRAAIAQRRPPTGIVLVDEPGRTLRRADVELALGAPVVVQVLVDPAVARAVDSGLLVARLPAAYRRRLGEAA